MTPSWQHASEGAAMKKQRVIDAIADAIAHMEGFYAERNTLAKRNANPGNIRLWREASGKKYPTYAGYVDFVEWASQRMPGATREEISAAALNEGWRVLRKLVSDYVDGKYTQTPPTFYEMFARYAPSADGNNPRKYAAFVAQKLGARPEQKIIDLIQEV
jgi:hypothetical protein